MTWNWQCPEWPMFKWDADALKHAERLFVESAGMLKGMQWSNWACNRREGIESGNRFSGGNCVGQNAIEAKEGIL